MPRIAIPIEAVGRIAKSVGSKVTLLQTNDYVVGPPDPNKDLSYRLHRSLRGYYLAREGRSDADKKLQVRKLLGILKTGSKLRDLLKSPQSWDWLKEFEFEALAFELEHALPAARSLIDELELKIKSDDGIEPTAPWGGKHCRLRRLLRQAAQNPKSAYRDA
jgi:hypothetical protein